jgi:hypothetical protein
MTILGGVSAAPDRTTEASNVSVPTLDLSRTYILLASPGTRGPEYAESPAPGTCFLTDEKSAACVCRTGDRLVSGGGECKDGDKRRRNERADERAWFVRCSFRAPAKVSATCVTD